MPSARVSLLSAHAQGGIHRKDNCLSSEPGTSRSFRVPAHWGMEVRAAAWGHVCGWACGLCGLETSSLCVRQSPAWPGSQLTVYSASLVECKGVCFLGYTWTFRQSLWRPFWDCSDFWWCCITGHGLVPRTRGFSQVPLAHPRAPLWRGAVQKSPRVLSSSYW